MTTQSRLNSLQRLVTLYGLVEEMHSLELQRVTAAVQKVQVSIHEEESFEASVRKDGRNALQLGNRLSWWVAETHQEASVQRKEMLEEKRQERAVLQEAAMEQYVASRMRKEQMKRLQDNLAQGMQADERRRAQAISDDRFLARRRWTDNRETQRLQG